ncbi:hypothetical protein KC357_g100 [Hortaea werneckii]|nr:hypothetical protein KC357_g100 [Hortaea werneckii]
MFLRLSSLLIVTTTLASNLAVHTAPGFPNFHQGTRESLSPLSHSSFYTAASRFAKVLASASIDDLAHLASRRVLVHVRPLDLERVEVDLGVVAVDVLGGVRGEPAQRVDQVHELVHVVPMEERRGTSPDFSEDLVLPLYMVWRITAGRLGSPITLTVWRFGDTYQRKASADVKLYGKMLVKGLRWDRVQCF